MFGGIVAALGELTTAVKDLSAEVCEQNRYLEALMHRYDEQRGRIEEIAADVRRIRQIEEEVVTDGLPQGREPQQRG